MIHDSRIDWPPPIGSPVTFCCHLDVEPFNPEPGTGNHDWDDYVGADKTLGVTWWDTWEEAVRYWLADERLDEKWAGTVAAEVAEIAKKYGVIL